MLGVDDCNTYISQAANDVRTNQDTLADILDRIGMYFRRLETYTDVPLTTGMMDIIVQIMVEVLSILGIATTEIKRGRMSESFMNEFVTVDITRIRNIYKEANRKN